MNFQLLIILCSLSQTFGDGPCIYEHHYCNPTAFDLIRKVTEVIIEDRSECEAKCTESSDDGEECTHYTFFKFRGLKTCFLLAGCNDKKQACPEQGTCESGAVGGEGCSVEDGFCDKITPDKVRWRCKNGINPYKDTVPVGTPCYTYCSNWLNEDGDVFAVKSLCEGNQTWGTPKLFPPKPPPKSLKIENIKKPDENWDEHGCHENGTGPGTPPPCNALKLTYNPNDEAGAMFHCDTPVTWTDIENLGGVKIENTNRCHFFCEKMLISITECKDGIWKGGHNQGYWCLDRNEKPPLGFWGDDAPISTTTISPNPPTTTTPTTTIEGTTTTLPESVKCATGWTPHSNMCYKKFTEKATWTAAEENCKNNGGDLASVKDKATNDFLKTFWTMDPVTPMAQRAFWLGGINTQDGGEWKWKWSADSTVFDSTVKDNWAKGKPSKRTDENDYYLWLRRDGKWLDDKRKIARRGYFCQKNSE